MTYRYHLQYGVPIPCEDDPDVNADIENESEWFDTRAEAEAFLSVTEHAGYVLSERCGTDPEPRNMYAWSDWFTANYREIAAL